jgi:predicted polyphosphate/ATP-dependent NAD kinase
MGKIAVVVNPNSGKDIRRLATHATVISNAEKINILKRIISTVSEMGDHEIFMIPDRSHLAGLAIEGMKPEIQKHVSIYPMKISDTQDDTTRFAKAMADEAEVDVMIVLGGDGTCRAAAKATGDVPLIPISTGTNNTYPTMMEGTAAALAAAAIASGVVGRERCGGRGKRIEVEVEGRGSDIALIDAAFSSIFYIGARAVLNDEDIRSVLVTQSHPASIGFSALAGCVEIVRPEEDCGLFLDMDWARRDYIAAISAGVLTRFGVKERQKIPLGEELHIRTDYDGTLAFDGERELPFCKGEDISLKITRNGPRKVEARKVVEAAFERGFFAR